MGTGFEVFPKRGEKRKKSSYEASEEMQEMG